MSYRDRDSDDSDDEYASDDQNSGGDSDDGDSEAQGGGYPQARGYQQDRGPGSDNDDDNGSDADDGDYQAQRGYQDRGYQQDRGPGSDDDDGDDPGSGSDDGDDQENRRRQYRSRDAPSGQYELTEPGELPPPPDASGDRPYPGDYINSSGPAQTTYDSHQTWDANVGPAHIQPETASRVQPPVARRGEAYYEYSQMTGNRKALLIGINYLNAKPEQGRLNGCENDVKNMERYLTEHCSYDQSDIMVLTEDGEAQYQPTRKNMIAGMRWLTQGAQRHDALFFHYSGHGGQRPDGRGQTDEIYPVDFYYDSATRSFQQTLTARDLNNLLVVPLPAGCRLTTVIDACHSASALALPYSYDHAGEAVPSSGASGRPSPADVIEWAGCRDDQTSADADEGGQPQGAMTWAFLTTLTRYPRITYQQLLLDIRDTLQSDNKPQVPQLSSSHPMQTTNLLYVM